MNKFQLTSTYTPKGDQPKAIKQLTNGLKTKKFQTLLGVTGSGKTFTMANVIQNIQKPTLIISHNKTLAAQLYSEFKEFFPNNAVEYFVSYYDYYQPESYIASTDTYIAKDAAINDKIELMRLSTIKSLIDRKDVIVIASVSCIYGSGQKKDYEAMIFPVKKNQILPRNQIIKQLVDMQYEANNIAPKKGNFRVSGDTIDVFLSYEKSILRIETFGDEIEELSLLDSMTNEIIDTVDHCNIFPAKHFVMPEEKQNMALDKIEEELQDRINFFMDKNMLVEAKRIKQRTEYDLEMIREIGHCNGIENYSRHFDGRKEGQPPSTLIDMFDKDYLLIIDESHVTLPQLRAMYHGDHARKMSLIENGFRLESAYDNRPLKYDEFYRKINNAIFVSATPSAYEVEQSNNVIVEQVVRPTGLLDPKIEIRPCKNQVKDVIVQIKKEIKHKRRVLVTTITKKQAEELSSYMDEQKIKTRWLHSEVKTLDRANIIRDFRLGKFDVICGVNLLREGLDIPEVSLVAILDADKEGFLRNTTSLVQTVGRASRNIHSRAILYADKQTKSVKETYDQIIKRRKVQEAYNKKHGITPKTIEKNIAGLMVAEEETEKIILRKFRTREEKEKYIVDLEYRMKESAENLDFDTAIRLRDELELMKSS
ncbi:MAG: excinuclease ABC subunit B [Candidatus Nanohalarchaeota archaeon]|nr:MAG: excinuclease ABC subunit B [Candidatus Nanohaloarchaeota archaeon]